jgi:hypothetical protein
MIPKDKPTGGAFLALPMTLLHSTKFRALSANGVKLLLDIGSQYNGKNNGDLSAAWKVMKPKGWKSQTTLNRAKVELLAAGFIAETRKGHLPNLCSLYGITWQPVNPSSKLDAGAAGFPVGAWMEMPHFETGKNAMTTPETGDAISRIAPVSGDGRYAIAPVSGDIGAEIRPPLLQKLESFIEVPYRSKPLKQGERQLGADRYARTGRSA